MTFASPLRRTLLVALACVALFAPAAVARPVDLRAEAPTSSLSGTKGTVFEHLFDPYPEPTSAREAALAQERAYSTYDLKPTKLVKTAPAVAADSGDGIAALPFALALFGALAVGLATGSGLHRVHTRRHAARLAT
jgi:hypothetical protein